jgi:hypothetical protein
MAMGVVYPDSYNQAADLAKFISEAVKTIESERKRITQPMNESLKATNSLFKKLSDPLESALTVTKGKILKYKMDEDRRAREKLEREQSEARALQEEQRKKEQAALEAGKPPPAPLPQEAVANLNAMAPTPTTAARGGFGSVTTQKRWTFRVVNKSLVPPGLLEIDTPAVNALIKEGIREIAGLEIFQVETAVVR